MAYNRPALADLVNRILQDVEGRLQGANARPRRSVLNVFARVWAGATHGLYGFIAWISRQVIYDTADDDVLERHASLWLSPARIPAGFASGPVIFTGSAGTIPAGSVMTSTSSGQSYVTLADATIASGTASATVDAQTAGAAGNMEAGETLTLASPIAGISSTVTVDTAGVGGGADAETDDELRARLAERLKRPPQGGADYDYAAWARGVPGVTRAWVYPKEGGAGTVTVRFMRDNDAGSAIPSSPEVVAVQAAINAQRPVTAKVTAAAPNAVALNFTLSITPDNATNRASVTAALAAFIAREATPGGSFTIEGVSYTGGSIPLSRIDEAISLADGEFSHHLASPNADLTSTTGNIYQMGVVTFT